MASSPLKGDISDKLRVRFDKARLKFLEEKAKNNGIVIVSDIEGNVKHVPAKQLLTEARAKFLKKDKN